MLERALNPAHAGFFFLACIAVAAWAQEKPGDFPRKPVRVVIGIAPGGGLDTMTRLGAQKLSERWGKSVIVDNRPGGGTVVGMDIVAHAPPDGYTLLGASDTLMLNGVLKRATYDVRKVFVPIVQLTTQPYVLLVNPSVPAKSVQELVALAKAKPGALNYGSSGNGSPQHLGTSMLQYYAGIQMLHVPYKGAAPAINDLLPGRIQVWIGAANSLLPHIKDGRVRLLAAASSKRSPLLPDTPTIAESGYPGYALDIWLGVTMPAKVPAPIVAKVSAGIAQVLNVPEVKAKLAPQGVDIETSSPQALARLIRADYERWGKIIKAAGIKGD